MTFFHFRYASFYLKALFIFPGLICNTLSFLVFMMSRMRSTSTGHYLLALTIFDTLVLIGEFLKWLNEEVGFNPRKRILGIQFLDTNDFACKFINFIRYSGRLSSAWTTVFITLERFVTVYFPLNVNQLSTTKLAKCVLICLVIIGNGLSSFTFFTLGVIRMTEGTGTYCAYTNRKYYDIFYWITVYVGDLILPSITVCILTALIIITLLHARSSRKHHAEGQHVRGGEKERQVTLTLTLVAAAFVVLRGPYCVSFPLHKYRRDLFPDRSKDTDFIIWATRDITAAIAVSNYMINFFLYSLGGSIFRRELKQIFWPERHVNRHGSKSHELLSIKRNSYTPGRMTNATNL